ncbi:MAG: flavodoxin [Bacteroidales bacterium]
MKILLLATVALLSFEAAAQKRSLVTYFSVPERDGVDASTGASRIVSDGTLYGATEYVAKIIAESASADLFQIKTTHTYPAEHKALIDFAKREVETKSYPKIASKIPNFDSYDVIFVGYPNWWYDMPMVIYTLFNEYDFTGKVIVPFCTHGGSGFSESVETIKKLESGATVNSMPAISRNRVASSKGAIEKWVKENGYSK